MLKHLRYIIAAVAFAALLSVSSCEWQPTTAKLTPPSCNLCEFKETK